MRMTHVDTLISRGQSVSADVHAASQAVRELRGELDVPAGPDLEDDPSKSQGHDLVRLDQQRWLRARVEKIDLELDRSIASLDTVDLAMQDLPTEATTEEVLSTLADVGVSLRVLQKRLGLTRAESDRLVRSAWRTSDEPPNAPESEQVTTLRTAIAAACDDLSRLAAEHDSLTCDAGSTEAFDARVRLDETAMNRHVSVETIGDLINFGHPVRLALGHVSESTELVEAMCRTQHERFGIFGFVGVGRHWRTAANRFAEARAAIATVSAELSRAISAIDNVRDLDNVEAAAAALIHERVSLTSLLAAVDDIDVVISQACRDAPVDADSGFELAVYANNVFRVTARSISRARRPLVEFIEANTDIVERIDAALRESAGRP